MVRARSLPLRQSACLIVTLGCLALVAGCGRRGPPVAPRRVPPAPVANLAGYAVGSIVHLSWTRPTQNEDGSPLREIREFRLFRREGEGRFAPLATVRGEAPDNAEVQGPRYVYRDLTARPDTTYTYRLQVVNRRGIVSAPSRDVIVELTFPPGPPRGVRADPGDGHVELGWEPPTERTNGSPIRRITGYNVYRGDQSERYRPAPINPEPVRGTRFVDVGVANDVTHFYVVRAVDNDQAPWHEGPPSDPVSATPEDRTPPAPPRGLQATAAPGSVGLLWPANTEPDLLGYHVYRSDGPGLPFRRLTREPLAVTNYADRAVESGRTYAYQVTAVDRSPRRNESFPSDPLDVSVP